ncbi:6-phospho-beta-glucosidase [Spiroplasma clarkii]|uniref:6-phospho-beta-glucosidase n=1 Tax=Spiroplasma clarkii TaxID=2139 RepID=A0A1Y0L063_9MOLU|nr:glycoside hydrolase family 1 protein [Spiroplasma clarkii]ARU91363.1 6-phospho-beta-glucosidase [Spiroplasma clarkii]ATX70781.1 6-phospho-beta-glucosidase [Spiroplasma clarkii]
MIKFKDSFVFGGSMSSIQNDGQGPFEAYRSNYDLVWEKKSDLFFNKIGHHKTCDFMNTYKEDLVLLKACGIDAIRHSFALSKLFPTADVKPNPILVKYYHELIAEMKKNNIKPMMTIMHFDMPEWMALEGGLASEVFVDKFLKMSQFIIDEYGAELEFIATFNEPIIQCGSCFLVQGEGGFYPHEFNMQKYFDAINNVIISTAKTIAYLKTTNKKVKVGIVVDLSPAYPRNSLNQKDLEAVKYFTAYREESLLIPLANGEVPQLYFKMIDELGCSNNLSKNLDLISKNKSMWIGINYYIPSYIKEPKPNADLKKFERYFSNWDKPIVTMNKSRGWIIKPDTMYEIGMMMKNKYHNIEWFITENGIAIEDEAVDYTFEGKIIDDYRIEFYQEHLKELHKAITAGSNCSGYLIWTPIDSWSYMNAYKNRYGLIQLDLETYKKIPKKSATWFKELSVKKGF